MLTTHLREVDGSVMLAVPPAILDLLHLQAGGKVGISVDDGHLVLDPHPRYSLDGLLAECDSSAELTSEDRHWLDGKPVGNELL